MESKRVTIKSLHKITRWYNGGRTRCAKYEEYDPHNPDFVTDMVRYCGNTANAVGRGGGKVVYAYGYSWLNRWVIINE